MTKLQNKPILPNEILDRILIKLNNIDIAIKLDRYYSVKQIYNYNLYLLKMDWSIQYGYLEYINYLSDKNFKTSNESTRGDFKYKTLLKFMYRYESNPNLATTDPALDIIKFLYKRGEPCTIYTMKEAAKNGHLNVVKFLHGTGSSYIITKDGEFYCIDNASIDNQLQLLQQNLLTTEFQTQVRNQLIMQLRELQPTLNQPFQSLPILCLIYKIKKILDEQLQILLQNASDQEMIQLINQHYQPLKSALDQILTQQLNNEKGIKMVHTLQFVKKSFIKTMDLAIENGHHETVEFLNGVGFKYSVNVMNTSIKSAINTNNFKMVKVLHKIGAINNEAMLEWSIITGQLDVVKLLKDSIKYTDQEVILASEYGHLEIVKFFYENGVNFNKYPLVWASKKGHLKVVEYLISCGIECTPDVMDLAIENQHYDVVKFLHSVGEEISEDEIYFAVSDGNLEKVKCLHSIGAQCNKKVMTCASRNGDLEMLKFLHEIEVKCSTRAINMAIIGGHSEVYAFLKSIKN